MKIESIHYTSSNGHEGQWQADICDRGATNAHNNPDQGLRVLEPEQATTLRLRIGATIK